MPSRSYLGSPDLLANGLKVLELIIENVHPLKRNTGSLNPTQDVYSCYMHHDEYAAKVKSIGKKCIELTNKSLRSHRYEEAIKLLWILCQDTTVFDRYIFKALMLTLDNLCLDNKKEIFWNLLRKFEKLACMSKREIQLEYLIYGIYNKVPDLRRKTKEIIAFHCKRKYDVIDPIYEAYYSFVSYVDWLSGNLDNNQSSQVKLSAESAILEFKKVVTKPGNWDIFVLNLVKMLDYCDLGHEIEDVLLKYVNCNPNNINARIYLCVYLQNCSPDSEELINQLKILAYTCPSDERVLLLLDKWKKSEDKLMKCLQFVFMFLDYPSNGKNLYAWQTLSELLLQIKLRGRDDELKCVQSFWKSRCKCWHWLHFQPSQVPYLNECDIELVSVKIAVLSFFYKNHEFTRQAQKKFKVMKDSSS